MPVRLILLPQSRSACSAAYLLDPCYKGKVEFTVPYAVTSAASDYGSKPSQDARPAGVRNRGRHSKGTSAATNTVSAVSLGLFVFTPACAADESFTVTYLNQQGHPPRRHTNR